MRLGPSLGGIALGERVRLGSLVVRDRYPVEDKKYSYSPFNISELCFLKCEFEHNDLVDRQFMLSLLTADHTYRRSEDESWE